MSINHIKYNNRIVQKKTILTITIVILLTATSIAISLPSVSAKDVEIYAFLTAAPDPVGVDQTISVLFWLSIPPPTAEGTFGDRWEGMTIDITKPDGSIETKGPYTSDAVGTAFFLYTPTSVGTYTFQMHFPGQTLAGNNLIPGSTQGQEYIGDYFLPASSIEQTLIVQQEAIPQHPEVPLPTGYWTTPIYGENTNWASIVSNWLMNGYDYNGRFFDAGSATNPYTRAPNTAHIMWKRPIDDGGIAGGAGAIDGSEQIVGYYNGMSYEAKFTPPLVINGRLYYNIYPSGAKPGYVVVDLYTGEELWRKEDQVLSIGQVYDYESFNQHGSQSYLWSLSGSTWNMSDAFTGDLLLQVENASGGGLPIFSAKGDLLMYYLNGGENTLMLWNSSKAIPPAGPTGSNAFQWRPERFPEVDWADGIEWTVSVPDVPGAQALRTASKTFSADTLVAASLIPATETELAYIVEVGYDANTGAQLWVKDRIGRQPTPQFIWMLLDYSNIEDGIYAYRARDKMVTYAYDARTGDQIWVSDESTDAWAMFPSANWNAYGMNFFSSYAGKIEARDLQTGSFLWEYFGGSSGFDTPYGVRPFYSGILVADGKIFVSNSEHSPSQPMWKGQKLHVVDVNTGDQVWNISGWFTGHQMIIVNGYFIGHNGYDNQIYCIGLGPSKTTVTATSTAVVNTGVMISGTVMDQSPISKDTPAIADEDMTGWMEFLHMQQECPPEVHGVPVKLTAYAQDGSSTDLGMVTSDSYGKYSYFWTPTQAGTYRIVATFEGSQSYGPSSDETIIGVTTSGGGVSPSPSGTGGPTRSITGTPTAPSTGGETPIVYYILAAVVIVVIVVILAALILSKRSK